MSVNRPIRRALISVSDKTGVVEFAQALNQLGIELISTGGTASLLRQANLPVMDVSDYTGFNEMMDGRVKTLHPKIHGGILGRRGIDDEIMKSNTIKPIDLVIVNLYPFAETIANPNCTFDDAVENIDIGGPTMIRSAAKNFKDVTVIVDHNDYPLVLNEIQNNKETRKDSRFHLAIKAFEHTAAYDSMIANHFGRFFVNDEEPKSSEHHDTQEPVTDFPRTLNLQFIKKQSLRYGENSHQHAAFYVDKCFKGHAISTATQRQGKPLSFNNIADSDAALECVKQFDEPACVIVKHANPCGVAIGSTVLEAYSKAYETDPTSAFGGIIAFNRTLDGLTCEKIIQQQFVEVIIVPDVTHEAQTLLSKKPNIRLLVTGLLGKTATQWDFKRVTGGLLVQESDHVLLDPTQLTVVSQRQPSPQELADALFSWNVVKFVKSNAIVYAKNLMTLGIGAGQTSRVDSTKIAQLKAQVQNLSIEGATIASDAFFPFRDSIDHAGKAGIRCIIQPGGSVRDDEVIQAANEHDIAMIFTHIRHFRH